MKKNKVVVHMVSRSVSDYLECGIEETVETQPTYDWKRVTCKNCLRKKPGKVER